MSECVCDFVAWEVTVENLATSDRCTSPLTSCCAPKPEDLTEQWGPPNLDETQKWKNSLPGAPQTRGSRKDNYNPDCELKTSKPPHPSPLCQSFLKQDPGARPDCVAFWYLHSLLKGTETLPHKRNFHTLLVSFLSTYTRRS